jgi:uncharacterized protein (TIGR02246 family)
MDLAVRDVMPYYASILRNSDKAKGSQGEGGQVLQIERLQMDPDERAIRQVHSTWIEAVNVGDLACLLALMADDVVFLSPGQGPFGRDKFSPHFSAAHQQNRIRCISELEEVVVAGEVAYTRSRDSLSVIPRDGPYPEATQLAGHRMTVYRKQPDGRWLLARDAHTLSARPAVEC